MLSQIAMGIMALALVLTILNIGYAAPYVNSRRFTVISTILMLVSLLGLIFLSIFVFYVREANENYKRLLETEHLLKSAQKSNYETMLAKEEETRKFRHDINNHIICLKEFVNTKNIEQVADYIEQMQRKTLEIRNRHYDTGNEILDMLVNYYVGMLEDGVTVRISGQCIGAPAICHVELCSILSNPLQNAVEALNKQKQGDKYLKIQMQSAS